jgi:hypothetical protein
MSGNRSRKLQSRPRLKNSTYATIVIKFTANHRAENLNVPGCQPIIFFPDELELKKRPALL